VRIGIGYDVHSLVPGGRLVLGGVDVPFEAGLTGWSDADVLTHAIMDALLGAAALGDIGKHFPPGDPEYHNISSMVLLAKVRDKLTENGWTTGNIDATIVAERPRLSAFIDGMREQLAKVLEINVGQVSVKATTSEKMGFTGREEGIAVLAVALLEKAEWE